MQLRVDAAILKLAGIAAVYGIAFFVGWRNGPVLLMSATLIAYAVNAWAISSMLLTKWEQPERTFGMLGFSAMLTYAETFPPFFVAVSLYGS